MLDNEKRSSENEVPGNSEPHRLGMPGVGGRHKETHHAQGVGGYLDICNVFDSSFTQKIRKIDPRLKDLRDMGIGKQWIILAETIGYEAFIGIWMILGGDESVRIRMPPYSKYQKFKRNQLIKELSAGGKRREQIRKILKDELCEEVSLRHIDRLIAKGNIDK